MTQNRRQEAIAGFRAGKYDVLVATDIAARGIDVSEISHVINFDMPDTVDAYTHRIGRTGRAAQTGEAFTFTAPADEWLVRDIERLLGERIERRRLENFDYGTANGSQGSYDRGNGQRRSSGGSSQRGRQPSRPYGQGRSADSAGNRGQAQGSSYGASSSHGASSSYSMTQGSREMAPQPVGARSNGAPARQPQRRRRFVNQGRSAS
jgi:ATP-dependent RNA helicase RhlE